jgi:hypothetical protein
MTCNKLNESACIELDCSNLLLGSGVCPNKYPNVREEKREEAQICHLS